jgi:hypothetical protein
MVSRNLHPEADMRITFDLDEKALKAAMEAGPGRTKTAVINEALRDYARRRRVSAHLQFEGKPRREGNLDTLRRCGRRRF